MKRISISAGALLLAGCGAHQPVPEGRQFRPNLQDVNAVIDGKAVRVKASAKAIRSGLVIKPP